MLYKRMLIKLLKRREREDLLLTSVWIRRQPRQSVR